MDGKCKVWFLLSCWFEMGSYWTANCITGGGKLAYMQIHSNGKAAACLTQTSPWPPASHCPEVAISRPEWEGLSVLSSMCDDWLDTWVIMDPFRAFRHNVRMAWCPKKVTSMWDNIYTTISCLADSLWMQKQDRSDTDAPGYKLNMMTHRHHANLQLFSL